MKDSKSAYQIYTGNGENVGYQKLLEVACHSDIVLFGEIHDNPICHWLELELARDLFEKKKGKLVLGAEMFEADNGLLLSEYIDGTISEESFISQARLWENYHTDYRPLVELAVEKGLPFIATNVPRRYAAIVSRQGLPGLESLTDQAKEYMAPLPIEFDPELACYRQFKDMMGMMDDETASNNLASAQAIKDATMAHFILANRSHGTVFLHFNGTFHTDRKEGIVWYIGQMKSDLDVMVISSVMQDNIITLDKENRDLADFIIAVPAAMTRTFISF